MNRFFLTMIIGSLGILISCDNSVTIQPTDETHFVKYYGAGGSQFAADMVVDNDGFVILANSDLDEDNRQLYLLKTDEFGNELWSNTFGDVEREEAKSIDMTGSGGYVIAANIDDGSGSTDIKVWIVDQMGIPVDSAIFGVPGISETVEKVSTALDGGYIITGSTDESINGRMSSILILRTLPGTLTQLTENEWTTIHGEGTISSGASIFEFNNEFFTLGTTNSSNPQAGGIEGLKFLFFPLNNTGTPGNNTFYGEDDDQIDEKLLKTDGGFVLLGNTLNAGNSDIYIQKVSNGLAKQATNSAIKVRETGNAREEPAVSTLTLCNI